MKTKAIKIGNHLIGGEDFSIIAGPCSIESDEQFYSIAQFVKKQGAHFLRGGVFKLRTHPKSFQGLGWKAFPFAREISNQVGLPLISEVTDPRQIEPMMSLVDAFQVGSRNMFNYALLKELGKTKKPVILKRAFSARVEEWLSASEYLVGEGNADVILCERGIRSFETTTRNTFDLNTIAFLKRHSNFPIVADPSHATGISVLVEPMALAAIAAGADALMVEVHPFPSQALSDSNQALDFDQFKSLMKKARKILYALGRRLSEDEINRPVRAIEDFR